MSERTVQSIVTSLRTAGVSLVASLPDQWIADLIAAVDRSGDIRHVRVTREDEGVGICAGAGLAGIRAVLLCQNAGLLLSANILAAYAHYHHLPVVVLAAHRGAGGDPFRYQAYKGRFTEPVLDALEIPYVTADHVDVGLIADAFRQADDFGGPSVVLMTAAATGYIVEEA